jgi:hypothetical protein
MWSQLLVMITKQTSNTIAEVFWGGGGLSCHTHFCYSSSASLHGGATEKMMRLNPLAQMKWSRHEWVLHKLLLEIRGAHWSCDFFTQKLSSSPEASWNKNRLLLCTTSTPERRYFTSTRLPYISVHFTLILPHRPFEAVPFSHGWDRSQPCWYNTSARV